MHHDVVILGGGLASLALTRLLLLDRPATSVVSIDSAAGPARKVGESTVEIGAHFLHRRLRLAGHLARTQLPKNGLRFFFDDDRHTLSLTEASEDGPITFSYWQSYQLDRESLESDLIRFNREGGAVHHFGATGLEVHEASTDAEPHRVSFAVADEPREVTGRWLVDATGMKSLLGRAKGLLEPETRVPHGACWARFEGFHSPDAFLLDRGDRRSIHGRRVLSTNHLMNEGYWIWWIPLAGGLMSVGLVYDRTLVADPPRNLDQFVGFLGRHRMCAELMENAKPVDFGRLGKFAFRPQRYFTCDRTGAIGMAAGFVDPFYSGGSDFIALECDCLGDLILRDLAGEPATPDRVTSYDAMVRAFYEQTIQFVEGMYRTFASYELSVIRYRRDLHVYWNVFVWPYFSRQLFDPAFLVEFLPFAEETRRRGAFFARLLRSAATTLSERGELRRRNRGQYAFNQLGYRMIPYIRFERQMGNPFEIDRARRLVEEIDVASFLAVMDVLHGGEHSPQQGVLFEALRGQMPAIIELAEGRDLDGDFWRSALALLSRGLRAALLRRGWEDLDRDLEPGDVASLHTLLGARAREGDDGITWPETESVDLPAMRDHIQPPSTWTFAHTPWSIEPLDLRTIYDLFQARSTPVAALYR